MVDPVGPSGQVQNILSAKNAQKQSEKENSEDVSARQTDEVQISEEAINLSQVQDATKQVSSQLTDDESLTLSADEERLNNLI